MYSLNLLKSTLKIDSMKNSDLTNNQKHYPTYYQRHGTIESKNKLEIEYFLEKKSFL